ncbi:MAG: hypothetical protein WBG36_13500 [Ornithinimicrobium sp.]
MDAARARRRYSKSKPLMTWVPVRDTHGRVRMEIRWHVPDEPIDVRDRKSVRAAA